ncbi:MAG: endo alpha-1,4 polygalactosaminidase [Actinomycetota bacterium]|nr:endo alpha-1,4 polygalactosaminidase [Actinomycetota bacterium]
MQPVIVRTLALVAVLTASVTACSTQATPRRPAGRSVSLPPVHGRVSYQISGAYAPPAAVSIVDRDHTDAADPTRFSICYVNAYQAQADAMGWWTTHHPELLLRDSAGQLVIDGQWDEPLLDISTPRRRTALLTVVGRWIDECARRGYRAVEADNLDSYTRSHGRLSSADALVFGQLLSGRAHRNHLSLGQKNAGELAARAHRVGFDFAIAEECQVYSECDAYAAVYGRALIEIEYTDQPMAAFVTACRLRGATASVVLRDRQVALPGDPAHVERWCP